MKTPMIIKEDTRTLINIITELENMKDIYLVYEKRQIGKSNKQRVLAIMNDLEFLRNIAFKLDENEENKKRLEDTMTKTTEQIVEEYEKNNKTNRTLNWIMAGTTAFALLGVVFASI